MKLRIQSRTILITSSAVVAVIVATLLIIEGLFDGTLPFGRAEITAQAFSTNDLLSNPHTPPNYLGTALTVDSKIQEIPQLQQVLSGALDAKNNAAASGSSLAYVKLSMTELNSIKAVLRDAQWSPDFVMKDKDPSTGKQTLMHISGTLLKYNNTYYSVRFIKLFPL